MQLRIFATFALAFGLLTAACSGDDGSEGTGMSPLAPFGGSGAITGGAGLNAFPAGTGAVGSTAGTGISVMPPARGPAGSGGVVPPLPPAMGGAGTGALPPAGIAGSGPTMMPPPAAGGGMGAPGAGMPLPPATGGSMPTKLPAVNGACPMFATGPITVSGVQLQAWVGNKVGEQGGPLIIYWHGTGGRAATAMAELDKTLVQETMASGGAIVSMESGQKGSPIDWGVFTTGDFEIVDQVVACAVEQLKIDVRRIYTSGASAGGLAAGTLAYARSGYVAGTFPNSGGVAPWPGLNVFQDPAHPPAVFTMHGAKGVDMVVIDFGDSSMILCNDTAAKGGFAVDCDHGKGHVAAPPDLKAAAWTFMKAHPYGTKPSPYAGGLPAGFPTYCKIISK